MAFTHSSDKAKAMGNRVTESQRIHKESEHGWPGRLGELSSMKPYSMYPTQNEEKEIHHV
jgi:hypothetical protein